MAECLATGATPEAAAEAVLAPAPVVSVEQSAANDALHVTFAVPGRVAATFDLANDAVRFTTD